MKPLPLTLVCNVESAQPPAAWFIPGAEPMIWLEEIARWEVHFDQVHFCPLPRSSNDRQACGALAILSAGISPGAAPSRFVQPYGCRAGRLYLPSNASLHPPMSDGELSSALLYPLQIFHPAIGLIGYATEDLRFATAFLAVTTEIESNWNHADPGLPPAPPLREVRPLVIPTILTISDESRGDIGSAAGEELPRLPDESPLRGLATKSAVGILGTISWLARHLPRLPIGSRVPNDQLKASSAGDSGNPGWRRRLQQWSSAKIAALNASLARARHKELTRLLALLDRDVDEALRYALPLHSTPGRGVAPPGGRLPQRNTDFDPSALGRARPTDGWDTSQFHQQLTTKYREAANRELALGRYRRAAYIYAQLLGDFGAAANALRQGRLYREAAILYRDHLKDTCAAATCLEEGGLLLEAIPLYMALDRHEKVGDLYAILERRDEAREHYQRATDELARSGDLLNAARVSDTKLDAPDQALVILNSGWPHSHRAGACLRESFELMGRRALHELAATRLLRLESEFKEGALALTLADVLAHIAVAYPNADLRALAGDATRVVVGNRLTGGNCGTSEVRTLVNAVMRLVPQDRLLARDASRYLLDSGRPARPVIAPALLQKPPKEPTLVRAFHLGGGTSIKNAFAAGEIFYVLEVREDQLVFIRGRWDGTIRSTQQRDPLAAETRYRIERAGPNSFHAIPLGRDDAPLPMDFAQDISFPTFYLELPPDYGSQTIYALYRDENDVLWSLRLAVDSWDLVLYAHDSGRRLLSTNALNRTVQLETLALLAARGGTAFVLCGDVIHIVGRQRRSIIDLQRIATNLIVSNPHVHPRLVVTFAEGAAMIWPEDGHTVRFCEGLHDPVAAFTRDGSLVVIGRGRGIILRVGRQGVTMASPFEHSPEPPVAIVPTNDPAGFAVFFNDGLVRVMKLPPLPHQP